MNLREKYFAALKESQRMEKGKQLISKSALGPAIVALRDDTGRIVGFSAAEPVAPDEVARQVAIGKADVSKSATDDDANSLFDAVFGPILGSPNQADESRTVVAKSADRPDPNAVFDDARLFPVVQPSGLQPKRQVAKSANSEGNDDPLIGVFPEWLQPR